MERGGRPRHGATQRPWLSQAACRCLTRRGSGKGEAPWPRRASPLASRSTARAFFPLAPQRSAHSRRSFVRPLSLSLSQTRALTHLAQQYRAKGPRVQRRRPAQHGQGTARQGVGRGGLGVGEAGFRGRAHRIVRGEQGQDEGFKGGMLRGEGSHFVGMCGWGGVGGRSASHTGGRAPWA